jgi:hypothetical protein
MKKRIAIICCALVAMGMGFANPTPAAWGLDINLPDQPAETLSRMPTPDGEIRVSKLVVRKGDRLYAITQMTFPKPIPADRVNRFYEISHQNVLREFSGTMKTVEKPVIAGQVGRRFLMVHGKDARIMDQRAVLLGDSLYTALYDAPASVYEQKDADAFLGTIKKR